MARRISGGKKSGTAPGPAKDAAAFRPSRDELLQFIADNPDRSGRRDLAKAFGLKNEDRIWLKDTLRELEDEGLLESRRKRLSTPGSLPSITLLDIFERDPDGALLARPAETEGQRSLPAALVAVRAPRGDKAPVAGVGDRVLARIFPSRGKDGPAYTARVMKLVDKRRDAVLGVVRRLGDGGYRIEPVERRQAELAVDKEYLNGAKPGDLVEVEPSSAGRYGLRHGKIIAVLGSLSSEKAVSMIAIHAHGIPHIFPPEVLVEAEAAKPIAAADRMRTALLAAVSHDLRTPLASAKAAVTSLRSPDMHWDAADTEELLATADESLDRLTRLVANLLDMSRLQAGALSLFPRPAGLDEVVALALDDLGPAGREITVEIPETLPAVRVDPAILERVIVNLTENALRYSPAGKAPLLSASALGDRVELRVVDRGQGISDADKDRVFVPFQRLGDTDNTTGVGLGLALSRGLTEAMGGTLTAEDTPGGGLTMTVSLPAAPGD